MIREETEKTSSGPIGVFDSGYGGLTILEGIRSRLPGYDYLYLGDNARAPYGTRSFELVYRFTLEAVRYLFAQGCHLVILACNTASAKALRSIQQEVLPKEFPDRRVLGVIRPTTEVIGNLSRSKHVGLLATPGTVKSRSYTIEVGKLFPEVTLTEHACPMWVPLVENGEAGNPGADYFVKKYVDEVMKADPQIDTLMLGCTHYPILYGKIREAAPEGVSIVSQGGLVAASLEDYLHRHPEMDAKCSKGGECRYLTTESSSSFDAIASRFLGEAIHSESVLINQLKK